MLVVREVPTTKYAHTLKVRSSFYCAPSSTLTTNTNFVVTLPLIF